MNKTELENLLWKHTDYEDNGDSLLYKFASLDKNDQSYYRSHPDELNSVLLTVFKDDYYPKLLHDLKLMDGIIVSKQDRFHPVDEHFHDWLELAYIYSGNATFQVEGDTIFLSKGQCLLINRNTRHSVGECGANDILINFLIRKSYLNSTFLSRFKSTNFITNFLIDSINNEQEKIGYISFDSKSAPEEADTLRTLIISFLEEYYSEEKGICSSDMLDSYMTLILLELARIYESTSNQKYLSKEQANIIPVLRYIEENYLSATLESTAAHFHLNPNYLSGYIHRVTGYTFKSLIQTARLNYSTTLLKNTSLTTSEIAREVGYENINFFYKKFKEAFGCTPAQYRAKALLSS